MKGHEIYEPYLHLCHLDAKSLEVTAIIIYPDKKGKYKALEKTLMGNYK